MNMQRVQSVLVRIGGRSDLILAGFIGVLVTMMILPLPTVLIDVIIAFNMTIAISILMLSIYVTTPLQFSSFPTVLLLITLFRLALSIASTRVILLEADAGDIISAFGDFVVGGNLVVGFVIFFIVTIVQFIVITKGAERVAEVSARFSLDAMPGKQMSIDSDLRSGTISMEEARRRRTDLTKESQLFGSMDGAMKFVKGDSIAGIIIIFINMLGGISIGVFQQGMSGGEAAEIYSILTIGDGLVGQIPALFVAIAAGIIVTRVTNEESKDLGGDIGKQFTSKPYAIMVTAGLIFLLGLVPGFPTTIFMVLSIVMGGVGWSINKTSKKGAWDNDGKAIEGDIDESDRVKSEALSTSAPIFLEISSKAKSLILPEELNQSFIRVKQEVYNDIGVPVPKISFRLTPEVKDNHYIIKIHDLFIAGGELTPEKAFVISGLELLSKKGVPFEKGELFGEKGVWVKHNDLDELQKNEYTLLETTQIISLHLSQVIKQHAAKFIGIQEVHSLLTKIESEYSELIKEVQKVLTLPKISEVMRRLAQENVPIRDLRQILEVLAERAETEPNIIPLTEFVREELKEHISYRYSSVDNIISAFVLSIELEQLIQGSMRQSPSGLFLELDEGISSLMSDQISKRLEALNPADAIKPVIITSSEIRPFLRSHLERQFPSIPVLSQKEIAPSVKLNFIHELKQ
jgi:type III secretion protein V